MKDVALGQHFISIVLWLEFSCSVLSRHATSLFTFGGQAGKKKKSQWRDCAAESEGGTLGPDENYAKTRERTGQGHP